MSLFFNQCRSGCNNGCSCTESCDCACEPVVCEPTCNCACNCGTAPATNVAAAETAGPSTVRALLNTVIDSCCTTEDVCRDITINACDLFAPGQTVQVGTVLDVAMAGEISYAEVKRTKSDCVCVSTVRYNLPIRIYGIEKCGCNTSLTRDITVIRSAKLCCTGSSLLTTYNSQAIAVSAVVSAICCDQITISLCILFRSCLQQTMIREYTWEATPVCDNPDCASTRKNLMDSCDIVCGCTASSGKSCPKC